MTKIDKKVCGNGKNCPETELKPCPFCGGKAEIYEVIFDWCVFCQKCYVRARRSYKANVIKVWNRRAK